MNQKKRKNKKNIPQINEYSVKYLEHLWDWDKNWDDVPVNQVFQTDLKHQSLKKQNKKKVVPKINKTSRYELLRKLWPKNNLFNC
jgi:RNAse (barnase) inhibitor barstar